MPGRILAIGDIHGCCAALDRLLSVVDPQPEDTLVTLGDYVDRGPDSPGVIERLLEVSQHCQLVALKGNHELMMLGAIEQGSQLLFWLECGGQSTMDAYGGGPRDVPTSHLEFLQTTVKYHETDDFFFVHANYAPDLPLEQQSPHVLFWEHLNQRMPAPHVSGKTAVVGHTPQRNGEILNRGHLLCIDTFCYGGGWLTAVDLTSGNYWQADGEGQLRTTEE